MVSLRYSYNFIEISNYYFIAWERVRAKERERERERERKRERERENSYIVSMRTFLERRQNTRDFCE